MILSATKAWFPSSVWLDSSTHSFSVVVQPLGLGWTEGLRNVQMQLECDIFCGGALAIGSLKKIMSDFSSSSNKLVSFQSGVRDYFTSPSNCAPIHWTPGPTLSQNSKSCCWSWSSSVVWDALLSLVEELLVCNWWGVVIVPSLGRIT